MFEDVVKAAMDKATETLHDQFRPAQEDMKVLNEKVAQAVAKALESHWGGLMEKAKQTD